MSTHAGERLASAAEKLAEIVKANKARAGEMAREARVLLRAFDALNVEANRMAATIQKKIEALAAAGARADGETLDVDPGGQSVPVFEVAVAEPFDRAADPEEIDVDQIGAWEEVVGWLRDFARIARKAGEP